jgi:hypothetical protein
MVTVHGSERAPRERNVAAEELAVTNSLKSATLWGGVGGGEIRQTALFPPNPTGLPRGITPPRLPQIRTCPH